MSGGSGEFRTTDEVATSGRVPSVLILAGVWGVVETGRVPAYSGEYVGCGEHRSRVDVAEVSTQRFEELGGGRRPQPTVGRNKLCAVPAARQLDVVPGSPPELRGACSGLQKCVRHAHVDCLQHQDGAGVMRKLMRNRCQGSPQRRHRRAGVSALDYILVLGIILPLVAFIVPAGKRIIELTYEMICTLVAWPFM